MSTTTKNVYTSRTLRKKPNTVSASGLNNSSAALDSLDSISSSSTVHVAIGNGHSPHPVTGRWAGRKTLSRLEGRLSASQGSLARQWGSVSSLAPSERSTATFLLRPGGGKAPPLSKLELANAIPCTTSARFYLNYSSPRSVLTSDEQLVNCPLHLAHRCNPFSCYHPQMYSSTVATKEANTDQVCLQSL